MAGLRQALTFAADLYRVRADIAAAGYLRGDAMARLQLRFGRDDPYAIYDEMRARGPLLPTRLGNWSTTSHRISSAVLRDRRFGVRPDETARRSADSVDLSFLSLNPPDHTRLRRLAQPAFSPRAVARYRPRVERTVDDLLDRAARARQFDLVRAFAAPLPIAVITELLGVPDADAAAFARHGQIIGGALDGIQGLRHAAELRASDSHLRRLFDSLFALRRQHPAEDVVSQVVAAQGDQIEPAEMVPFCTLLLVAGFETTVNLIGNGVLALLRHPEQWAALREDPDGLAPRVVNEVLRYDPPVQRTSRVALRALELEGRPVHKGQWVVPLIGGANRDPEVYRDPAVFDLTRTGEPDHLAFSGGIHYCVGQPLAVLEATVAFAALARRLPTLRLAGPVRRRNATTIRGPVRLPVAV